MGGDPHPQSTQESTDSMMKAYASNLPGLMQAVNGQLTPTAQAQYQADAAVSPAYAQLQKQIYDTTGRQMNDIGNQIADVNAKAAATRDLNTLDSTGKQLAASSLEAQKVLDPEYYANRAKMGANLGQLLDSGANLTPGEMSQIERGLAQQSNLTGGATSPSQSNVVANAMVYGKAGTDRFTQALQLATQALPALKSGDSAYMMTTGKSATPNSGDAKFQGAQNGTGSQLVNSQGNTLLNNIGNVETNRANIEANRRTDWDRTLGAINGVTSSIGNIVGGVSGMGCWVAREVFGEQNPQWLDFRRWLFTQAPTWFLKLYMTHGESFAKWIHNKPLLKAIIRRWMLSRIATLKLTYA